MKSQQLGLEEEGEEGEDGEEERQRKKEDDDRNTGARSEPVNLKIKHASRDQDEKENGCDGQSVRKIGHQVSERSCKLQVTSDKGQVLAFQ